MDDLRDAATGNPIVDLIESSSDGDVRTTVVRVGAVQPAPPVAPASLIDRDARLAVVHLHRVVRASAHEIVFETYGSTTAPSPGSYVLQSWWLPDALALVADRSREWFQAPYPGDGPSELPDHGPDYCFLTYESLAPGEAAYTDGRGAWVSVHGFEEYIAGDLLRFRTKPATE
jgi:hypothetical protein